MCSFSTVTRTETGRRKLRVWVRNAVKIAAVLSASNHEKESCCCSSEAWVTVHSVWRICFVMPRETRHSIQVYITWAKPLWVQPCDASAGCVFNSEILHVELCGMTAKVEARRLFRPSGLSHSYTPNTLVLRFLSLASANHAGLA